MIENKKIVLFTTFWDAERIINDKMVICNPENNKVKIIQLNTAEDKPSNYSVYSIALMHPPLENLPTINKEFTPFKTLDFFCPTYKILMKYKEDKKWDEYVVSFKNLIVNRKSLIKEWILSLKNNHVYILCCWENTKNGANCHRKILYDSFIKSPSMRDKAIYLYRDGSKNYLSKEIIQDKIKENDASENNDDSDVI